MNKNTIINSNNPYTRRKFLSTCSATLAGSGLASFPLLNTFAEHSNVEYTDFLVLGAGMAGMTCAQNLAFPNDHSNENAQKVPKVIVLEGSQRIGGRILTLDNIGFGKHTELGAQYIHRDRHSVPIWDDVRKYDIKTKKIRRLLTGIMYQKGWENNLKRHIFLFKEWNIKKLLTFSRKIDNYKGPDISGQDWLDTHNYNETGRGLVGLYLTGHIPASLERLSIKGFASDNISKQEMTRNEYKMLDGFSHFVNKMAIGQDQYKGSSLDIRFGEKIKRIEYSANGVTVIIQSGKQYKANAAVITFSIGMLKSGEIEFVPPLPTEKLDALSCIDMGDEAKIVLKFKKRFWPKKASIINRIDPNYKTGRTFFIPNYKGPEEDHVLTALLAGPEADKIRNNKDTDIIRDVCDDLNTMFPQKEGHISNLLNSEDNGATKYIKWQWSNDQFSKGSDSYLEVHKEKSVPVTKARKVLAYPWSTPGLFWAGEATSTSTQPCSTHGAHSTGQRAAKEVRYFAKYGKPLKSPDTYM